MTELKDNEHCYVCGGGNRSGLAVQFAIDRKTRSIAASFTPGAEHQGFEGIVHGGILSALLDEAMAKLAFGLGIPALTAEIIVKFRSPAAPGDDLRVTGTLLRETDRLVEARAKVERGPVVIAEATGKLVRV